MKFTRKLETDLFDLVKAKTAPNALIIGQNGKLMGVLGKDRITRIFDFASAKIVYRYDDSIKQYQVKRSIDDPLYQWYAAEFDLEKRLVLEREIDKNYEQFYFSSLDFDESEEFLILPSLTGVKLIYLKESRVISLFGRKENSERFVKAFLYQGESMRNPAVNNQGGMLSHLKETDPILVCLGFKRNRFYLFSRRNPDPDAAEKGLVRGKGNILNLRYPE